MRDLTDKRFGKLSVVEFSEYRKNSQNTKIAFWLCKCDCGNSKVINSNNLISGRSQSCGCERIGKRKVHGLAGSRIYAVWTAMKARCDNPNDKSFKNYGGRGIGYDSNWSSFENFVADVGLPPEGMTLERVDNSKGYSKENCVWESHKAQSRNTRRNNVIEFNGEAMCLSDWASRLGIPQSTLSARINTYGWSAEAALTTPVQRRSA